MDNSNNATAGKRGKASVIKQVLGEKDSPKEFREQYSKLTEEDKIELAQGAAKALGLNQAQCDFPLGREIAMAAAV